MYGFGNSFLVGTVDNCGAQVLFSRTGTYTHPPTAAGFVGSCGWYQEVTTLVSNCYAACEFESVDNKFEYDCGFGGVRINDVSNVTIDNCYYKTDSKLGGTNNTSLVSKSEADLKAAGMVAYPSSKDNSLNYQQDTTPWRQDFSPNPINKGYPILGWMQQTPTATTLPATDIKATSATLKGSIFDNGETITSQGFQWRKAGTTAWTINTVTGTTISAPLTGLTLSTTYEYRAYVTTNVSRYGDVLQFITSNNEDNITNYVEVDKISIYPNPAKNQLIIDNAELIIGDYSIFSIVGQVVMQGNTSPNPSKGGEVPSLSERAEGEVIIDVSALASGMYFLKIDNKVIKFVKE